MEAPGHLVETIEHAGRPWRLTWLPGPPDPLPAPCTQVSVLCFTDDGRLVLVSADGRDWGLPGGRPEPGESPSETLAREVREEACCEVVASAPLGCQVVSDPGGRPDHVQLRWWCRVRVLPYEPRHEIAHRRLVAPAEFPAALSWGRGPIAAELLRLAGVQNALRTEGCQEDH